MSEPREGGEMSDLEALERYQRGEGAMHSFTCGNEHRLKPDPPEGFAPLSYQVDLIPVEREGRPFLVCPEACGWEQDATQWMPMVRGCIETARLMDEYRGGAKS